MKTVVIELDHIATFAGSMSEMMDESAYWRKSRAFDASRFCHIVIFVNSKMQSFNTVHPSIGAVHEALRDLSKF